MKKNILISTGGSGGHVVPATSIYNHLKHQFDVSITSDNRGVKFLDKTKYNVKIINVPKISKNIFLIPFQILLILKSIFNSYVFLKREKFDILISTGGYMSLPLCIASKIFNIKLFLFEPNMVLGKSNKFFINYCAKIFCYSDNIKNFPNNLKNKISIIPAILRKEFYSIKTIKDTDEVISILIIGGSQGAKLFDNVIKDSIIDLSKNYKIKIYHQTNFDNYENLKSFYLKNKIENELFNFNEDVFKFMSKSNICITRAGASTLAELIFLKIPHIAIPLPTAKDNHQFENALFYQKLDCNWILNQNEINKSNLIAKLRNIIENKGDCSNKKKNMENFNYQNTWDNVNQKIITTINEN